MQKNLKISKRKQAPQRKPIRVSDLVKQLAELQVLRELVRRAEGRPSEGQRVSKATNQTIPVGLALMQFRGRGERIDRSALNGRSRVPAEKQHKTKNNGRKKSHCVTASR